MKKQIFTWIAVLGSLIASSTYAQEESISQNCTENAPAWYENWEGFLTERPNIPGFYVGTLAGVNSLSNMHQTGTKAVFNTGYLVGANAGYQFCSYRLEGEFAYRFNSLHYLKSNNHKFKTHMGLNTYSLMANGYWDINIDYCVRPYIGMGYGYAWNEARQKSNHTTASSKKRGFAWQAMVGVNYDLMEDLILSAEYRYFHSEKNIEDQAVVIAVKYAL